MVKPKPLRIARSTKGTIIWPRRRCAAPLALSPKKQGYAGWLQRNRILFTKGDISNEL